MWFDGVVCMSSRYAVVWFDEAEGKRGLTLGVMTVVDALKKKSFLIALLACSTVVNSAGLISSVAVH